MTDHQSDRPSIPRRAFLTGAATLLPAAGLGAAMAAWGTPSPGFRATLQGAEGLTMTAQRALIGRDRLAPEFTRADIRQGMRPNGSVNPDGEDYLSLARDGFSAYVLPVGGLVERPLELPLSELRAMPARTQITRHDCVEGWSCIAEWTGVPLGLVLDLARPLPDARYVAFRCFDAIERGLSGVVTYYESIDLIDARHPQTILAYAMNGAALPVANGAPLRLRVERQLGYKMAKYIRSIDLVPDLAALGGRGRGSYWADRGYEWYAGV